MDSTPHDTAADHGNAWSVLAQLLAIGFALFAAVSGFAFIWYGAKISLAHGPAPTSAAAVAGPATPTAPPPPTTVAVTNGEITLKPGTDNPLTYDIKSFSVKAGQKLKVTFNNQSALPQPHNFILGKLGSKDRLMAAVMNMAADPNGFAKGYIPESPDIIIHTKLLNAGQTETLDFTAPAEKGDYPYLCSFPGHALIMNGVMKVE